MKIQRYPGKAVDASLSLDRNNAMVELYEANWYQAHQNFGQPRSSAIQQRSSNESSDFHDMPNEDSLSIQNHSKNTNEIYSGGSYLRDGVSTLSKYQMNLEQIRALEEQSKDESIVNTLKDLNGYKPSTLKRTNIKLNRDWEVSVTDPTIAKQEETQDSSITTSGYGTEKRQQRPRQQISIKPPSLKRSQTMIYNIRSSKPSDNNLWLNNNINHSQSSSSSSSTSTFSFHSPPPPPPPDGDVVNSELNQTVISKQPQPQKKNILSATTLLPALNCDSSTLSTFSTNDQQSRKQQTRPPTATMVVNRSKSVRFPANTQKQQTLSIGGSAISTMPKSNRHRKISLDIKQDSLHTVELLKPSFENLNLNSKSTSTLHTRQGSDSSTSSAQSSNASSSNLHDQFVIPRPRLIVPVHTYARKRRTGNLKDQDLETINNDEDDIEPLDGKIRLFGLTSQY